MPEDSRTPKVYDTCERDGRYAPIRTNPEEDPSQVHTDGEILNENLKTNTRRSNRNIKKNQVDTVAYVSLETFGAIDKMVK